MPLHLLINNLRPVSFLCHIIYIKYDPLPNANVRVIVTNSSLAETITNTRGSATELLHFCGTGGSFD